MLCTQCHTSNSIDYNFCRECGAKLASDNAADPQVEQLLARAFSLLDQGQFQEAREAALAVLVLDGESVSAHSVLALAYEREGNVTQAIREYETVLERNPDSTADRLKLAALRGETTTAFPRRRWTPQQISVVSALAAGVLVFGGGVAVITQMNGQPAKTSVPSGSGASYQPASANAAASASTPQPRPIQPLPTPPTPLVASAPPPTSSAAPAARPSSSPALPGAGALRPGPVLRPSAPLGPLALPGAGGGGNTEAGLAPAGIGEVVPLPQVPATAPGGPVAVLPTPPGTPVPATSGTPTAAAAGPAAPAAGTSARAHAEDVANEKPRRELMEPETGFIRIEPIAGGRETRPAAALPKGPPPTISLNFVSTEGEAATLGDAQRALRGAQAAARQADSAEAERQYRQAMNLFEILARRGGSGAKQAREGLAEARRALSALR